MVDEELFGGEHNMPPVLSVGELSQSLKRTVEEKFGSVRVRGEVSQPKVPGSGHCYLRLKDQDSVIDAVIWRGVMSRLGMKPEDGMEVICTGRLTTYPGRSTYQIIVEQMELAGEGALLKMIEERRRRLAEEGLFADSAKKALPYLPEVIGVVTSPTGAVIKDILHRLSDRFPRHVLLWPVKVQGPDAAGEVAAAVAGFNHLGAGSAVPRPDVLIVARGGGSLEDLMAFNEEVVIRAVADSVIPVISAVGHETDTTLVDLAADRRAPTPTAAAEMAVPVRLDLVARLSEDGSRMAGGLARQLAGSRQEVAGLARGLPDPRRLMETAAQTLDDRSERLALGMGRRVQTAVQGVGELGRRLLTPRQRLAQESQKLAAATAALSAFGARAQRTLTDLARETDQRANRITGGMTRTMEARAQELAGLTALLNSFSYQRVLERGFTLVTDAGGNLVKSVDELHPNQTFSVMFQDDGWAQGVVTGTSHGKAPKIKSTPRVRTTKGDQGSLL